MEDGFIQQKKQNNGFSIAAMICGIFSVVCCCFGFTFIIGAAGIILAIIGIIKFPEQNRTMGIVALILSIIGTILGIFTLVFAIALFQDFDFNYYLNLNSAELQQDYLENYLDRFFGLDMINMLL